MVCHDFASDSLGRASLFYKLLGKNLFIKHATYFTTVIFQKR
jgi:hypothetical protein